MSDDGLTFGVPKLKFQPVKLRRTRNIIEDNLQTLCTNKKKIAQDKYYAGQSPLTRSIASMQQRKQPVHQRLGVKQRLIRRRNGLNNGLMQAKPQRLRLRRTNIGGVPNAIQSTGRITLRRTNSVQQRLYKIRPRQQMDNTLQTSQIKLRRRPPTNFTVEVDNTNFRKPSMARLAHSVRGSLNQQLQSEIQVIQNQSSFSHELIASEPIFVPGHGTTGVFINDRFSRLP